ncbi:MAG: ABC transporter permease [Jatrophihabitans sp.]|uniref:ABC transporter permease n=1 Tax=Jatrophihabitans sp. TaxID=1932789 RepID=UPI003F820223
MTATNALNLDTAEPPYPGLERAGARLPIDEYTRRIWQRRWFTAAYASASNAAGYEGSFLGQSWQLLTPLLNIAVYYLIFGVLLHTNQGIHNFIGFLSVGIFVFGFTTGALNAGARSITANLGLVRALQFPRAVLPLSTTLVQLQQLINSMVVLIPILLLSGEQLSWRWLLLAPAIGLQTMFNLGLTFAAARMGAKVPDTAQVLPFVSRVWMYLSGVMYSVHAVTASHAPWVASVLTNNPGYIYLALARNAVLSGSPVPATTWLWAIAWSVGTLAVAYLYFWRGEEEYGNV